MDKENKIIDILSNLNLGNVINMEKLPGDASSRHYFRVFLENKDLSSVIVMDYENNVAAKSEEIGENTDSIDEEPFVNVHRLFNEMDIPVPKIIHYDEKSKIIVLNDLGDTLLEDVVINNGNYFEFYEKAIYYMVLLHSKATKSDKSKYIPYKRRFDYKIFFGEFLHYLEYGLEKTGYVITPKQREELLKIFQYYSTYFESLNFVVTHRDFHSRNIMVNNNELFLIDFQDALMGPIQYDLASLLRDAYVVLSDEEREKLIRLYLENYQKENNIVLDEEKFVKDFDLIALQRNLKAIGRFFYISIEKGKDHLLKYVPNLYKYLDDYIVKYEELYILKEILDKNGALHKKILVEPTSWRDRD